MSSSDNAITKRRPGRPATGKGQQVVVRLQPDLLGSLDAYATDQDDAPTRPEAIRRILQDWLLKQRG